MDIGRYRRAISEARYNLNQITDPHVSACLDSLMTAVQAIAHEIEDQNAEEESPDSYPWDDPSAVAESDNGPPTVRFDCLDENAHVTAYWLHQNELRIQRNRDLVEFSRKAIARAKARKGVNP